MTNAEFYVDILKETENKWSDEDLVGLFEYSSKRLGTVVVEKPSVTDTDRWHTYYASVIHVESADRYFMGSWMVGSTEYQECDLNLEIVEVYPHVVTKTEYKTEPQ